MSLEKFFHAPASLRDELVTGHRIPAPPRNLARPARWIPPGETVEVLDYIIRGGMLYVGVGMKDPSGTPEPSLINPALPVEGHRSFSTKMLDYWPNYSVIAPDARGAYLSWLASGKDSPDVEIGFVTLYFYGLERRAFIDAYGDERAAAEWPALRAEVERLQALYGHKSFAFNQATTRFLEMMDLAKNAKSLSFGQGRYGSGSGLPVPFKRQLGELATLGAKLTAELALDWANQDPSLSRPTAVHRCKEGFDTLFLEKYRAAHPGGLPLPVTRTQLRLAYEPASQSVAGFGDVGVFMPEVPDVTTDGALAAKIQKIMQAVALDLDPFSRYVGRHPDRRKSLEAQFLLPVSLWPETIHAVVERWKATASEAPRVTSLSGILASFGETAAEPSRDLVFGALGALFNANVWVEPDLSGRLPKPNDPLVLFACDPDDAATRALPAYAAAKAAVQLAYKLATSLPGEAVDYVAYITPQIAGWTHLSPPQRARLAAYAHLTALQPPAPAAVKRNLAELNEGIRVGISLLLCKIAHAAGDPSPAVVTELTKAYKLLGLKAETVHSDLHAAASGSRRTKSGGALDHSRIAELQADTQVVSALLSDIFTEETAAPAAAAPSPATAVVPAAQTPGAATLPGLDAAHAAFAQALLAQPSWDAEAVRAVAAQFGLMPDGALERLNDAAFDAFDMPFSEGDDPLDINPDLLKELNP